MLQDCVTCIGNDLWALGIIMFQMFAGKVPFRERNDSETYKKIIANDYAFPSDFP